MHTTIIGPTLFIAGAQAAVCRQPDGLRAWQLNDDGELVERHLQAQLFLDCPSEKRVVHDLVDLQQLKAELQRWSAKHHTLYCLLAGMDRDLRDTTRRRRLVAAEALLADPACAAFARARLLGCVMPERADLASAMTMTQSLPHCDKLYRELALGAKWIPVVKQALQEAIVNNADPHFAVDETALILLDYGIVADGVAAHVQIDQTGLSHLQFDYFETIDTLPDIPNLREILSAFYLPLRAKMIVATVVQKTIGDINKANSTRTREYLRLNKRNTLFNAATPAHSNGFSWKQVLKPKLN